jgi:YegS/Rv2252/BmrU family lipid kinase
VLPSGQEKRVRPIAVILNSNSGTGKTEAARERVAELCQAAGREAHITVARGGDELRRAVDTALATNPPVVVAGGGDGTMSTVAGALAGRDVPLGVLPLGTLNHFAKDLGVPLDLDEAVAVVLAGRSERIDMGEVNGRLFLNNASLGLYPLIVRQRKQHRVHGPAKWIVGAWATLREIRRHREIAVRIVVHGKEIIRRTPILFVGNNRYHAGGRDLGSRETLRGGHLAIYIVKGRGRRHLLYLAAKMLAGRDYREELEVLLTAAATIEVGGGRIETAVDGELEHFEAPLEYRIRPQALSVLVPPAS